MTEDNPYAAPGIEVQQETTLPWRVEGTSLFVKHGTVLPEVDLETGEMAGEMKTVRRSRKNRDWRVWIVAVLLSPLVFYLRKTYGWENAFPTFILLAILCHLGWRFLTRKTSPGPVVITDYWSAAHSAKQRRRTLIQGATTVFLLGVFIMAANMSLSDTRTYVIARALMYIGIIGSAFLAVWSYTTQDRTRTGGGSKGWLHIDQVHPEALAYLREVERQMVLAAPERTGTRDGSGHASVRGGR